MAWVTVYLPADVLEAARKQAREAATTGWSKSVVDILRHGSGDLVEPDEPPLQDVETLR